jgi:DNA-binding NarL/FixJ family response regulator
MRLFIADDSELLRERLVDVLSEIEGVEIIGQGEDTIEVVKAVERLHPDLVILDIRMPGGNGILVLEILKKMENPPLVIMFTNYPNLQYRMRCLEAGADFFFYKATEFEKLIDAVKRSEKAYRQNKEKVPEVS